MMSEQQGGWPQILMKLHIHQVDTALFIVCHSSQKQRNVSWKNRLWSFQQMVTGNDHKLFSLLFCGCSFCSWVMFLTGINFSYQGFSAEHSWFLFMQWGKTIVYASVAVCFPGAWTFLWFVCFCMLASQWGRTHDVSGIPEDAARATVAFSFFSIATWVSWTAVVFYTL